MLKYVLLATAITVAAPAVAQTQATGTSTPATTTAPGAQAAPGTTPMTNSPTQSDTSTAATQQAPADATTAQTTTTPAQGDTAVASTPAAPASKAEQVAQVVNAEFPSYDKDASGSLNTAEFASWMVALKSASDPTTKADDPATKTWVAQAFAQADKDKSKTVSKAELEGFLSQAAG